MIMAILLINASNATKRDAPITRKANNHKARGFFYGY